jgi:mannitol-specific phosphotransferase system IIBC component
MNEDLKESFKLINNLFMVIFTCEAVMKISAMGCDYFRDSWNKFDFTVVVGTIVVLLIS